MTREEVVEQLRYAGEEICDDAGQVIGYVAAQARFKIERSYLSRGGFLVVERDDQSGEYVASEWDALQDGKSRKLYPAGYCLKDAWRVADLQTAVERVMDYFSGHDGKDGPA